MRAKRIHTLFVELFGYEFLNKTRETHLVEARATYFYYLYMYENMKLIDIQQSVKEICGKKYNHATILHAIRNYPIYVKYNELMPRYLMAVSERLNPNKNKVVFIQKAIEFLKQDTIDEIYPKVKKAYNQTLNIEVK